ncbi:MAG: D-alanyl-D-alanine carboxypeptidase [Christensenellaceae bacterium]|nr:D-alanyl-D-alanine carboxypeptidase [Christensenellaceae bacterium]
MVKKRIALILAVCVFLGIGLVSSAEVSFDTNGIDAALLMDADSGRILYEHEKDAKLPVAGLSKLPALLMICEAFDVGMLLDDTLISVSDKASKIGGTTAFLASGEQMRAADMMMAAVMINAGDAIHSLACAVTGSENAAVERINERMKALGVEYSASDICGSGLVLSAAELSKIGLALLGSDTYCRFGTMYYETIEHATGASATELANPNKLIKQYSGCLGIATGSSAEAGYCAIFAATRGTTSYIAVVLGADNSSKRFGLGIEMLDYGFASFRNVLVAKEGDNFGEAQVVGGIKRSVNAVMKQDVMMLMSMADTQYFTEVELYTNLVAPIYAGQEIGIVRYTDRSGALIMQAKLVSAEAIEKSSIFDYIRSILHGWISNF